MIHDVRLNREKLISRHQVSERLAARVGALLGRGVGVTGAVLELARPGSPAEKVLLHPDVLARAGRLTTAALARLRKAARAKGTALPPLVVVSTPDAGADGVLRVVALEEEALAEAAWKSRKGPGSKVPRQKQDKRRRGARPCAPTQGVRRPASPPEAKDSEASVYSADAAPETAEALRERILRGVDDGEREAALYRLAESLREGAEEVVAETAAFLRGLERDGPCPAGPVARSVGVLLSGSGAPADLVTEAAADYRRRLAHVGHPEALLAALGWMASGPRASEALKRDVLILLLSLLERASADASGTLRHSEQGAVVKFGDQDGRRMDYRRDLIGGAGRILGAGGLSAEFRGPAVQRLLAIWSRAANYDIVWAPGDMEALADALAAAAAGPETPPALRAAVIRAVRAEARSIPVIRALGNACAGADADPAVAEACREAAEQLETMLRQPDYSGPEDQEVLLAAVGRIAAIPRLAAEAHASERVRERLADRLFEGLARKRKAARAALGTLAESANVPATLRAAIRTRLADGRGG